MSGGKLVLSPNEEATANLLALKDRRIQRILQVRKQQKEISHKRTNTYNKTLHDTWKALLDKLNQQFVQGNMAMVAELQLQIDALEKENFGNSYVKANTIVNSMGEKKVQVLNKQIATQVSESNRIHKASDIHKKEKQIKSNQLSSKQSLLQKIKTIESQRTQSLVSKYNANKKTQSIPIHSELIKSVPLNLLNRKLHDKNFTTTFHHSTKPIITNPAIKIKRHTIPLNQPPTSLNQASLLNARAVQKNIVKERVARDRLEKAKARGKEASKDLVREHEKNALLTALSALRLHDTQRKQQLYAPKNNLFRIHGVGKRDTDYAFLGKQRDAVFGRRFLGDEGKEVDDDVEKVVVRRKDTGKEEGKRREWWKKTGKEDDDSVEIVVREMEL